MAVPCSHLFTWVHVVAFVCVSTENNLTRYKYKQKTNLERLHEKQIQRKAVKNNYKLFMFVMIRSSSLDLWRLPYEVNGVVRYKHVSRENRET